MNIKWQDSTDSTDTGRRVLNMYVVNECEIVLVCDDGVCYKITSPDIIVGFIEYDHKGDGKHVNT